MKKTFAALLLAAGCGSPAEVAVDTSAAADIPRDLAVAHLKDLLPTSARVLCTLPETDVPRGDVAGWNVDGGAVWIRVAGEAKPLVLTYYGMKGVRLQTVGGAYHVRVFTRAQRQKDREHFAFVWDQAEPARRAVELFEVLRVKE
jgi:hypothetical protein